MEVYTEILRDNPENLSDMSNPEHYGDALIIHKALQNLMRVGQSTDDVKMFNPDAAITSWLESSTLHSAFHIRPHQS